MTNVLNELGTDEAGFGPNLGPLVIAATRWTGPVESLRDALADVASDRLGEASKLTLADSKAVHRTGATLAGSELAAAARGTLAAAGIRTSSLRELVTTLAIDHADPLAGVPWFEADALDTPPDDPRIDRFAQAVRDAGLTVSVQADVIPAGAYNALLDRVGSKGQLLSRRTLRLLRHLWGPGEPAAIVCDKHGGRDKYRPLLQEFALDAGGPASTTDLFGPQIETLAEGRLASAYRIGDSAIRFEQKAERHLPVACASLVAKWIRERAMDAFNAYWAVRRPDVPPTRGYPNDAVRWREAVGAIDGVDESILWRRK